MGEPEQEPEEPVFTIDMVDGDLVARPLGERHPTDELHNLNLTYWVGMVGCPGCGRSSYAVVACLRQEGHLVRKQVPCPRCHAADAVPESYWYAKADLVCPECFYEFVKVFLHQIDILPDWVDCNQCGARVNVHRDHAQDDLD